MSNNDEKPTLQEYLTDLANALDNSSRHGADVDIPEGVKYLYLSDTLANMITTEIRDYVHLIDERTQMFLLVMEDGNICKTDIISDKEKDAVTAGVLTIVDMKTGKEYYNGEWIDVETYVPFQMT